MPVIHRTAGRKGNRFRRARQQCIDEEYLCVRCGAPVDKTLSGRHRDGPSVDHWPIGLEQIIKMGGDPNDRATLRLAHMGCNAGARDRGPDHPGRVHGVGHRGGHIRGAPAGVGVPGGSSPRRVVVVSREW